MARRKYKQEYLDTRSEMEKWITKYNDCKNYIREARNIIIKHNLQEELNDALNKKYGFGIYSTIMEMNRTFCNEKQ